MTASENAVSLDAHKTTLPVKTLPFVTALVIAFMPGTAAASDKLSPDASQVRVTEVTERSHPFETLYCARQPIQIRYIGNLAEVVVDNQSRILMQAISASGARYVAPGDDTTELWGKGSLATVTWSGQELSLCAPSGAVIPPYRASGNEPFWSVTFDGWRSTLMRPGEDEIVHDAMIVKTSEQGQTLAAGEGANGWQLQVRDGLCMDDMSGMPHPQHAILHYQSTTMHGCGGAPERLLEGVDWHITHIDEQPVNAATPYIRFLPDNKIAGNTGCNRFFGNYALTGESLSFTDLGSTRMACPPDQMALEEAVSSTLTSVYRFSFEDADIQHLILHGDGTRIRAEAPAH